MLRQKTQLLEREPSSPREPHRKNSNAKARASIDASEAHGWLLEAKSEAMSLPSWERLRRIVREHVYAQLDAHGGQRYFSDLSAEARTVMLKEAYQVLRREPQFVAFGRDLGLCVDNKLLVEAQGQCPPDSPQQRTLEELLKLAAEAGTTLLRKQKGAENGLLRGLIGQRIPKVLRCELWRSLLVKREARAIFLSAARDAGQPAMELKVLERLQELFAAHFPASSTSAVMVAKQLAVCSTLSSSASGAQRLLTQCSQSTLYASAAVVLVFDGPQGPTVDPPELAERHAALLDILQPMISLVTDKGKQREVLQTICTRIKTLDPELMLALETMRGALPDLASVEDLLVPAVVATFWERLFLGSLPLESSFFILDLFILAGVEPSRIETVVIIATSVVLLACSRRLIEFQSREGSKITDAEAVARLLIFAAADVSPIDLESQAGHFESDLFKAAGADQSSRKAEEAWLIGNPNPPPISPRDVEVQEKKAEQVKKSKAAAAAEQSKPRRAPLHAVKTSIALHGGSPGSQEADDVIQALRALPEVPRVPFGADPTGLRWDSLNLQVRSKDVTLCLPPIVEGSEGGGDTLAEIVEASLRLRGNGKALREVGLEPDDAEVRQEVAAKLRVRFPGLVQAPGDSATVLEASMGNVSVSVCVSTLALKERSPSTAKTLARAVRRLQLRDETLEAGLVSALLKKHGGEGP